MTSIPFKPPATPITTTSATPPAVVDRSKWRKRVLSGVAGGGVLLAGAVTWSMWPSTPKPSEREVALQRVREGYKVTVTGNSDGFNPFSGPPRWVDTRYATLTQYPQYANDPEIVEAAVARDPEQMRLASSELRANRGFVTRCLARAPLCYEHIAPELRADREIAMLAIKGSGDNIMLAPLEVQLEVIPKEFLRVRDNANTFAKLDVRLRGNVDVIFSALHMAKDARDAVTIFKSMALEGVQGYDLYRVAFVAKKFVGTTAYASMPERLQNNGVIASARASFLDIEQRRKDLNAKEDALFGPSPRRP